MDDRRRVGEVIGSSVPLVMWTPKALDDLDRARRRFAFWARWHPLASRRKANRDALAFLDGLLQRGIEMSNFYEHASEYGRRYAATVAHGAGKE